jgi:hypothetical protein
MNAIRIIETPAARRTDPFSSHEASALHTASGARQCHIAVVTEAVRKHPGLTSAELATIVRLERHEVARRLPEAQTAGTVTKGRPRRCTQSQKRVTTWWPV